MTYTENVIQEIKTLNETVLKNLGTQGLFPDRSDPVKKLPEEEAFLLKLVYQLRICFLEELTFIYSHIHSPAVLEKTIIRLENMDYLRSAVSKEWGKYFCLTKKALYFIMTDHSEPYRANMLTEDKFPGEQKLAYLKCINGFFANYVFTSINGLLWQKYKSEPKEVRVRYCKEQYLTQYGYLASGKVVYSKKQAADYIKKHIGSLDEDTYQRFTKASKKQIAEDPLFLHAYLKDYARTYFQKTNPLALVEQLLYLFTNSIFRSHYFTYRKELLELADSRCLKYDYNLFLCHEMIKRATITRRSTLNTKTEDKSAEELKRICDKLNDLDAEISAYQLKQAKLDELLSVPLFEKFNEDGVPIFSEDIVSLDALRNLGVHILSIEEKENEKPTVTFGIFQTSSDEVGKFFLFPRLEKIFRFWEKSLAYNLELQIIVYGKHQKESVQEKLKDIKADFKEIGRGYALFVPFFDEICIRDVEMHFRERYEVFRQLKPLMEKE